MQACVPVASDGHGQRAAGVPPAGMLRLWELLTACTPTKLATGATLPALCNSDTLSQKSSPRVQPSLAAVKGIKAVQQRSTLARTLRRLWRK